MDNTDNRSVTILYTEDDIRRYAEIVNSDDVQITRTRKLKSRRIICAVSLAVSGIMLFMGLKGISGSLRIGETAEIGGFWAGIAILYLFIFFLVERSNKKALKLRENGEQSIFDAEMERRKNGFLPRVLTFEEKGIRTQGRHCDFLIEYGKGLTDCCEYEDGMFLFNAYAGKYLWIPARFFSKEAAEYAVNKMKEIFGEKYSVQSALTAAESPETPEPEPLIQPQSEPLISVNIKSSSRQVMRYAFQNSQKKSRKAIFVSSLFLNTILFLAITVYLFGSLFYTIFNYLRYSFFFPLSVSGILKFVILFAVLFSAFLIYINTYIPYLRSQKCYRQEMKSWFDNITCTIYDGIIVRESRLGKTVIDCNNLTDIVDNGGDIMIVSSDGWLLLPANEQGEQRQEIISALNTLREKYLPHEHECGCDCGCNHDHDHDHYEN